MIESSQGIKDLIDLLKSPQGVEFCMDKQFPPYTVLLQFEEELRENDIYVSGTHKVANKAVIVVYGGEVEVEINGSNVCEIYATNGAIVSVIAKDSAYVSVELWHSSGSVYREIDNGKVKEFRK